MLKFLIKAIIISFIAYIFSRFTMTEKKKPHIILHSKEERTTKNERERERESMKIHT